MCGICGFTNANDPEANAAVLKTMCDIMAHRGPDGEGFYLADGVALGHRRLSLIDLEGGAQPMVREMQSAPEQLAEAFVKDMPSGSASSAFAIVFNGEIYNYQDIAAELREEGWSFETSSDTEVLLTGYMAWGADILDKLRGMFAFAIWDPIKQQLFCARDPFGIKPFYYTQQESQFIFASEIKSILEHPAYGRQLNREALEQYLCFQFSVLPETFFKGIFKLLPAHYMIVDQAGIVEVAKYWDPLFAADDSRTHEQTVDDIDAAMRESVRYHNVADVEVGSFLSSGIDSSYMAACLAHENPSIKTFTVGFFEYGESKGERDEISWAQELAEMLEVQNTSQRITEEEYWDALPLVQWHMDEPLADPSAVALYFVDRLAATQVKAVLSGEGADELFGGYKIYQAPLESQKARWLPKGLLKAGSRLFDALHLRGANYLSRASETVSDWYYTDAVGAAFTPEERARILKGDECDAAPADAAPSGVAAKTDTPSHGLDPSQISRLCRLPLSPQKIVEPIYERASSLDEPTQMQYLDILCWMVGDILLKTDKMSMAHSLESRVPFLDREVFAIASTIPRRLRVSETQTKIALREAAERAVPREWARKEKLGFPVPLASWLREERNYEAVKACFLSSEAREFFDCDQLMHYLERHKAGEDMSRRIFIVWMFLMWYRIYFVDRAKPEQPL